MKKTHSPAPPKIVGRRDVFGDECDLRWPPNELVILGAALRSHHREDRAAIWGSNRHPPPELEARLRQHAEAKQIHIELQRPVMVPNKDIGLEDAQIRILPVRPHRSRIHHPPDARVPRLRNGSLVFELLAQGKLLHQMLWQAHRPKYCASLRRLRNSGNVPERRQSAPEQPYSEQKKGPSFGRGQSALVLSLCESLVADRLLLLRLGHRLRRSTLGGGL